MTEPTGYLMALVKDRRWKDAILQFLAIADQADDQERTDLFEALDELSRIIGERGPEQRYKSLVHEWIGEAFDDVKVYPLWLHAPWGEDAPEILNIQMEVDDIFSDGSDPRLLTKRVHLLEMFANEVKDSRNFIETEEQCEQFRMRLVRLAGELLRISRSGPFTDLPPLDNDLTEIKRCAVADSACSAAS